MKQWKLLFTLFPLLGCSHNVTNELNTPKLSSNTNQTQAVVRNVENTTVQIDTTLQTNASIKKRNVLLNVPLVYQNPELKYGCEVTSLTMVLQYAGVRTDKMKLYQKIKKDPDPLVRIKGDIINWGDPADGFVGDMTGKEAGYAVFDKPIEELVNHYLPNRAVNLTQQPFTKLEEHVSKGFPIVVWTTGDYNLPDRWESWKHKNKLIKTPLDLHAVVLVGYNNNYVFLNDPLSGRKQVMVSKDRFISSWKALNSRAVSYK